MNEHARLARAFCKKVDEWVAKLEKARSDQDWKRIELLQRELEGYQETEGKMRAEANRSD